MGITFSNPIFLKDAAETLKNFAGLFKIRFSKE